MSLASSCPARLRIDPPASRPNLSPALSTVERRRGGGALGLKEGNILEEGGWRSG